METRRQGLETGELSALFILNAQAQAYLNAPTCAALQDQPSKDKALSQRWECQDGVCRLVA